MTHFKWLKKEVPRWVKEEIITREAGDSLISLYRNEERHSHGEGLFVLAAVCFLTGLIFICAGVWNGLSQDEQFMMALVPLVLSILIIAAILWQDRPVMDRIPAESVRLEEAENTAEPLSGETGGTVSAGSGIEENTAAIFYFTGLRLIIISVFKQTNQVWSTTITVPSSTNTSRDFTEFILTA